MSNVFGRVLKITVLSFHINGIKMLPLRSFNKVAIVSAKISPVVILLLCIAELVGCFTLFERSDW